MDNEIDRELNEKYDGYGRVTEPTDGISADAANYFAGDSAVNQLIETVNRLYGNYNRDIPNKFDKKIGDAYIISDTLGKTNAALGTSWNNCRNTCDKINTKIKENLEELVKAINNFGISTQQVEQHVTDAANEFNDTANTYASILDTLGK